MYNTEESLMINALDHHCLYFDRNDEVFDTFASVIPFCIRPQTLTQLTSHEHKLCYGKEITFQQLKTDNVTISDLFQWNGVIEMIDLYEKYLFLSHPDNDNQFYCNCSVPSQFGKYCEYIFNDYDLDEDYDERSFTTLYRNKQNTFDDEIRNEYQTYYIGISCQTNFDSFDWRQICNGVVDCDNGEDEPFELCLEMEINQCNNETEFRCKNGLCIPISLAYDIEADCLDRSDTTAMYKSDFKSDILLECSLTRNLECDEFNDGWKQFSCGDGQFISFSDLTSKINIKGKTCENNYHFKYLQKLFYSKNENQCWKTMICLTGFNYLYENLTCLDDRIEQNIPKHCSNEYYFPSNPVVYSYVYFLYDQTNRMNWFNYTGPNYICYKKEYCQINLPVGPTILKEDLTCFYVNQTIFSWTHFYEYILYLFSSCYSNVSTSLTINNQMLYKCNLSDQFISIYRIKDKIRDCYFNEDEFSNINLCLFDTNDQFQCITNENECIRRSFLEDDQYDCTDGSDEYIQDKLDYCKYEGCPIYSKKRELSSIYHFGELCDNIVNRHLFSIQSNETDETDCEYWPFTCYSPFTRCNKIWNCPDGTDEINCPIKSFNDHIRNTFHCNNNENYCIQLIHNNTDVNLTCIHINRTGDGIIDCIGATDERLSNICIQNYPFDFKQRFYCMNSSKCIKPEQVCDRIMDCPYQDDERICPWLFNSNTSTFYCQNSLVDGLRRCESRIIYDLNCLMKEHLWFCDLALESITVADSSLIQFESYPKIDQNDKVVAFENINSNQLLLSSQTTKLSLINTNNYMWLCNEGYPIQSSISNTTTYCLCPPFFYGEYCQYQSERLTLIIQLQLKYDINPLTVFRLMIYLIDDNSTIISYDEIVQNYPAEQDYELKKIAVHLMYQRMTNLSLYQRSKSKFVRIDSYIINQTNVKYISSWFYNVTFPFLPVNRLVIVLGLEDEPYRRSNCKKKCGLHGKCMFYINMDNTQYCWCDQGWYGEHCHLKSSSNLCNQTSCAPHSHCIILNDQQQQQIKCICPLGRSGPQCYINYNSCYNNKCQNNGTCLPLDQRILQSTCHCHDDYTDTYCQTTKKISNIYIPSNISNLSSIPAIIIIFSVQSENALIQKFRRLYKNISLPTNLTMSGSVRFGFIRMFYDSSNSFYYLIAIRQPPLNRQINTTVISENLCKNVSELFNQTILDEYSYLKRLKLYHLPCKQNKDLRCFYDEYRMCLCTRHNYSNCYLFNHEYSTCDYCRNNGLCLRQDPKTDRWNFFCLCPQCSPGRFCQLSTGNYYINLDMLIGTEFKENNLSFSQQPFIIHLTLILLIFIVISSLIFNIISLMIFSNKKHRQVGCDIYLFYLTILSQFGIILLFLRYLYTIISQIYVIENVLFLKISCIFLEYTTRLIPSLFDWLTVCISIERTYTVIKDIHFTKILASKTLKLSHWIFLIVILLNILTTLHRPFYLVLVDVPTTKSEASGHSWCLLDVQGTRWNTYEKIINIIHLQIPFILNLLSLIFFLFRKTTTELKSTIRQAKSSRYIVFKEQVFKYKPLLIGPMAIILLEIPRFIFTFALACIEHSWQRYTYLIGYLISFLPLTGILFIYIIPSPKYKKQLREILEKTCFKSLLRTVEQDSRR